MTAEELRARRREYQRRWVAKNQEKVREARRLRWIAEKAARGIPSERTCVVCGKKFAPRGNYQVSCSPECARVRKADLMRKARAESPRKEKRVIIAVCPVCGKTFDKNCNHQKYCSKRCKNVALNPTRKSPTVTKTCPVCGKTFVTTRKFQINCSKACYKAAQHRERQPVERVCVFCGKAFKSMSRTAKYCSRTCMYRVQRGYATLADFEKAQAERKAAHNKQYERDRNGLTLAQIQEVIAAQDGDLSQLWKRSQSWTKAQRKYAQKRYEENHGLFTSTYNP